MAIRPSRLSVHESKRFFVTEQGTPFLYMADTAWELFHRCNREEADYYLADRADKRFTVIQAVVLAELDGLHTPNSYGHTPLFDDDPTRPNPDYFEHVDYIVQRANALGLYVGMLPTWGDKFNKNHWGAGPEVFTPKNARMFGRWLGDRYKDASIIWILGGDRALNDEQHLLTVRAMAEGIRQGDDGRHLMGFHPPGGMSSSTFVHAEPWLDFHAIQSGHVRDRDNYNMIERDFRLLPRRPVVEMEPGYEDHPNSFNPQKGWLDQHDVRKSMYWALFTGAAGYTYGCHDIWQLWQPDRKPINWCHTPWKEALQFPGSAQLQVARRLVESRSSPREPAQWLIKSDVGQGGDHIRACRTADGSSMMFYIPSSQLLTADLGGLGSDKDEVVAWWYKPHDGTAIKAGAVSAGREEQFQPPFDSTYRDWILVLDRADKRYPPPGSP